MRLRFVNAFASIALPPIHLSGCIRAYVTKDTTTLPATLEQITQVNYYPASLYCGLVWYLQGESEQLDDEGHYVKTLPAFLLIGPQEKPFATRNPGHVQTFGVVFSPQFFHRLTGLDMGAVVNAFVCAESVLPGEWLALCGQVQAAPDNEARMQLVETFVSTLLRAPEYADLSSAKWTGWLQEWQNYAHLHKLGGSVRSLERYAKRWAGQSLRRLLWMTRAEGVLTTARHDAATSGHAPRWLDVAHSAGYADQSHLCREVQRITGHSPTTLARHVDQGDDRYWFYRLWS